MKYRIEFLDSALFDLETIKEYVAQDSVAAANRLLRRLRARIDDLANMPKMNPVYEDDPRFRRMVVDSYLVFYCIHEQQEAVEIHHVWHGMRNIAKLLQEHGRQ